MSPKEQYLVPCSIYYILLRFAHLLARLTLLSIYMLVTFKFTIMFLILTALTQTVDNLIPTIRDWMFSSGPMPIKLFVKWACKSLIQPCACVFMSLDHVSLPPSIGHSGLLDHLSGMGCLHLLLLQFLLPYSVHCED